MKFDSVKKIDNITVAGFLLQLLFAIVGMVIAFLWNYPGLQHLMWHAAAPLGVWIFLCIPVNIKSEASSNDKNSKPFSGKLLYRLVFRYGSTVAGIFLIVLLLQSFNFIPFLKLHTSSVKTIPAHFPLILFSVMSFTGILISLYYIKISALEPWQYLRGVVHYFSSTTLFFLILLVTSIFNYSGWISIDTQTALVLKSINHLLTAELLFVFVSSFFKPPSSEGRHRPFYQSYLLEIALYPQKTGQTIRLLLQSLSGFEITAQTFARQIHSIIIPLLTASCIFMFLLSSFVIIRTEEQGIRITLGRADPVPLDPGIHLKLPFPFAKVRKFDVFLIRQMHIGSHKPQVKGGTVFREGVPLLWTTDHGLSGDELLIVASPRMLMQNAAESGGKVDISNNKTPSVSLAGADIVLDYTIDNVKDFSVAGTDPEKMLFLLSEAEVSRHLLSFDIDTLFSDGRLVMAQELKNRIQAEISKQQLGMKIFNISITAVHPPTEIADVFEENVAALQERETKIQLAQQSSLRAQVEAAGSVTAFRELTNLINIEENGSSEGHKETEVMILKCGGAISRIISEATGYRWSRENIEGGKAEKFIEELNLFKISRNIYSYERYFSILEVALASKKKIIVSQGHKDLIVDFGSANRLQSNNILIGSGQVP